MNYEHIRRLTKDMTPEQKKIIITALSSKGVELYEKIEGDVYRPMNTEDQKGYSDIYVSAADLEYAGACVTELGLQKYLCTLEESQVVKSAAEQAEEEYYKRRKIRLIECAVVILLGAVYMIYKSLAG